ncbi:MAG TPA: hypothetical protein VEC14_03825, partial [Reyranellaceae bacterium]|nr:hypothetical protein [Reyranellaceae bacterium]
MRTSPIAEEELAVKYSSKVKDYFTALIKGVDDDVTARQEWLDNKRHFFRRRYALEWRNPTFPWPGASEIVMPTIDMNIDRLKPMFVNLVAASNPPVTVLGATPELMQKAPTLELFFEWLIRVGSPNFLREIIYCVDDMLETGRGILKTLWQYETRTTPDVLTYETLPPRLREFVVVPKKDAQAFKELSGKTLMTPPVFQRFERQITQAIQLDLGLDPDEDEAAIAQVKAWLQAGADGRLAFKKKNIVTNAPRIVAVSPMDLVVPAHTTEIDQAERITHVMHMTRTQIRARAHDGKWSREVVKELLEKAEHTGNRAVDKYYDNRTEEEHREGVRDSKQDLFEIRETCCWMDVDGDGRDEKCVVLWSPDVEAPLRFRLWDRPSQRWPYHTAEFELNKRRWYSPRGVPEKIADLDAEITAQHRAKLNRMTIANAPTFMYRMGRNINVQNFRWVPGQMVPVSDPLDVQPMVVPN